METQAAKARRSRLLWAVLLSLLVVSCLTTTAEATQTLPSAVTTVFEPGPPAAPALLDALAEPETPDETFGLFAEEDLSLFAALSLLDAPEIERLSGENRFRIFAETGEISHLVERVLRRKTALPASTSPWECNVLAPRDLAHICVDLFFQGAWTDPTTGIAYHRNRWYDPRTANWLSEDPLGAVDSPNLYAFVGWGPQSYRDPMGLRKPNIVDRSDRKKLTDLRDRQIAYYEQTGILVDIEDPTEKDYEAYTRAWNATLESFDNAVEDASEEDFLEHGQGKFFGSSWWKGAFGRGFAMEEYDVATPMLDAWVGFIGAEMYLIPQAIGIVGMPYMATSGGQMVERQAMTPAKRAFTPPMVSELKASSPVKIPSSATVTAQDKSDYLQIRYRWTEGSYKYEARWHTRTPGAPPEQGNTWVVTRTTPGTPTGVRKTQQILTGEGQWTSKAEWQAAVAARQAGTATEAQQELLDSGHWSAH